ncbi:response regulator transcription factor [Hahella ganghwensis]|uniref:response regulator transcription factor n=1 Tax=Hahella ganghwensis TaxID=286420 RepID=UPI0003658724|nr:response regulator transcription factor [Hahella ganghwensis]
MRILLVEDEALLRNQLLEELSRKGYAVDTAEDGEEAAYLGMETSYDLAVVDIGLPKKDGLAVVKEWREKGRSFPILILTARGHWQDKVNGLEVGADDYLVKPFHLAELLARMSALVRRASGFISVVIEAGPIVMDTAAKSVQVDGRSLELTAYEYNTLEYLVHRAGKAVSKMELTEHLYAQDYDRDSNVIEVFIGRLRKKLDPEGIIRPISTLRGQGYRFELPVNKTGS